MLLAPAHKEQNRPTMRGESAMERSRLAVAVGLALLLAAGEASAAELTVLCSNALKSVLEELGPQFEKASGHKLKIEYGSTGPLKAQIEKGQAFDVAILGVEATDDLIKRGVLAAGSRADIARSGMGSRSARAWRSPTSLRPRPSRRRCSMRRPSPTATAA